MRELAPLLLDPKQRPSQRQGQGQAQEQGLLARWPSPSELPSRSLSLLLPTRLPRAKLVLHLFPKLHFSLEERQLPTNLETSRRWRPGHPPLQDLERRPRLGTPQTEADGR